MRVFAWIAIMTAAPLLAGCASPASVRTLEALHAHEGDRVTIAGEVTNSKIPFIRVGGVGVDLEPRSDSGVTLDDARGRRVEAVGRLERFVATYTEADLRELRGVAGRWPDEPGTYETWTLRDAMVRFLDTP